MANAPISEELTALKKRARRRLVGACALVLLALSVLWAVMDEQPPQGLSTVAIVSDAPRLAPPRALPPAAVAPAPSAVAPKPHNSPLPIAELKPELKLAAPARTEPEVQLPPPREVLAKPPAKPKPPEIVQDNAASKSKAKDPARILAGMDEDASPSGLSTTRYFVRIGAFANQEKAEALMRKAQGAGVSVLRQAVHTDKGELHRLRAGPYATRELADKAHAKLNQVGISNSVVGVKP